MDVVNPLYNRTQRMMADDGALSIILLQSICLYHGYFGSKCLTCKLYNYLFIGLITKLLICNSSVIVLFICIPSYSWK